MSEAEIRETWAKVRKGALVEMQRGRPVSLAMIVRPLPALPVDEIVSDLADVTIRFEKVKRPDGGFAVVCDGVEVEAVRGPQQATWSDPNIDNLCWHLNQLPMGDSVFLSSHTIAQMSYNYLLYSDLWHAIRGKLIGSAYGTFRRDVLRDGWAIVRQEEGKRIYDRDGYPV